MAPTARTASKPAATNAPPTGKAALHARAAFCRMPMGHVPPARNKTVRDTTSMANACDGETEANACDGETEDAHVNFFSFCWQPACAAVSRLSMTCHPAALPALAAGLHPADDPRSLLHSAHSSLKGFELQKSSGQCAACKIAGCVVCSASITKCEECMPGQGLVGGTCQPCPQLPQCIQCDATDARKVTEGGCQCPGEGIRCTLPRLLHSCCHHAPPCAVRGM